jgi:hypothetical protein
MLKRVSLRPRKEGVRLAAPTGSTTSTTDSKETLMSPAMSLAAEQISARPREFVEQRRQANGE